MKLSTETLFVLFIFSVKIFSYADKICPTVKSYIFGDRLIWPNTTTQTLSEPPCVNENKELLYRQCLDGEWEYEPTCSYIQYNIPPQCPEGFTEIEEFDICYMVSEKRTSFPPKCPYEDVLPFNSYRTIIKDVEKSWMPVQREGLDYMRWTEASSLYKTEFEDSYSVIPGLETSTDCLIYYFKFSEADSVFCKDGYHSLCVYNKFDLLTNKFCRENCYQSDFNMNSTCFCLDENNGKSYTKAEFVKPYQNNIYPKLTNKTCAIGLEKDASGNYTWFNSRQELDYTFWSTKAIFDNSHLYGASTPEGWILTEEKATCSISEEETIIPEPSLNLHLDEFNFKLTVHNPKSLKNFDNDNTKVYCFTDADVNLLYRYPTLTKITEDEDLIVYAFDPLESGPGYYWCESFRYPKMELVTTEKIFVRNAEEFPSEFVMELQFEYDNNYGPYCSRVFEILSENVFSKTLNESFIFRFMSILKVQREGMLIWVNVHFTSKIELDSVEAAMGVIEFSTKNISLNGLKSSDFCEVEKRGKLSWPKTPLGTTTIPKELCIKSDGSILTRKCEGSFINGTQWEKIEEVCNTPSYSSVTQNLLDLLIQDEDVAARLRVVSEKYSEFSSADLNVVAEILTKLVNCCHVDPCDFSKIINNLMKINKTIINVAQEQYNSAAKILQRITEILGNFNSTNNASFKKCENGNSNFHLMTAPISEVHGVFINKSHRNSSLRIISIPEPTIDNVKNISAKLEYAIWISSELSEQMDPSTVLSFTVFFNDFFFTETSEATKIVGPIFGLALPNFTIGYNGSIQMLIKRENTNVPFCSSWSSNWKEEISSEISDQFFFCEFWQDGYFALTSLPAPNINITAALMNLLNSSVPPSEVVMELEKISKDYNNFKEEDIYYVGMILRKISADRNIDLQSLTQTVSNLHKIPGNVLINSQAQNGATDLILHGIDIILNNSSFQFQEIERNENFSIFIFDVKETNFSGLALFEDKGELFIDILTDYNIEDLANYKNLSSAVLVDEKLKNQLEDGGKIIITYFSSNVLFNELITSSKQFGKIFGVILPQIGQYKGPVTILHRIHGENKVKECSYWNYNENLLGSWVKDVDGEDLSALVRCDFWHTTHFTLILSKEEDPEQMSWVVYLTSSVSIIFCIAFAASFIRQCKKIRKTKVNIQ